MLEVKSLAYEINGNALIKGISFFARNGEVTSILGESGAGKSTILKIIAGLIGPYSGEIKIEKEIQEDYSSALVPGNPNVKLINQKNDLFPNITLHENLAYKLRFYEKTYAEKRTKRIQKLLKIDHLENRYPREVSGGELQRWQIALAIIEYPKVLLLDEPFSNLDPTNKIKMKEIIEDLTKNENLITLMVTHDINDAFGMSNYIDVLRKGRIIQHGQAIELYEKPKNSYVAGLTGIANLFNKVISKNLFSEEKNTLVRPDWIKIANQGKFEAIVLKCQFIPPVYHCKILIDGTEMLMMNDEPLEENSKIRVDIKAYQY